MKEREGEREKRNVSCKIIEEREREGVKMKIRRECLVERGRERERKGSRKKQEERDMETRRNYCKRNI